MESSLTRYKEIFTDINLMDCDYTYVKCKTNPVGISICPISNDAMQQTEYTHTSSISTNKKFPRSNNLSNCVIPTDNIYKYGIHYEHNLTLIDLSYTISYGDLGIWACSLCETRGVGPVLVCLECNTLYCSVCLIKSAVGEANIA